MSKNNSVFDSIVRIFFYIILFFFSIDYLIYNLDLSNRIYESYLIAILLLVFINIVANLFKIQSVNRNSYFYALFSTILLIPAKLIIVFAIYYSKINEISCSVLNSDNKIFINNIEDALYFSAITWTTLGYGDCIPTNTAKIYATIEALIGYIYSGVIIVILFNFIEKISTHWSDIE